MLRVNFQVCSSPNVSSYNNSKRLEYLVKDISLGHLSRLKFRERQVFVHVNFECTGLKARSLNVGGHEERPNEPGPLVLLHVSVVFWLLSTQRHENLVSCEHEENKAHEEHVNNSRNQFLVFSGRIVVTLNDDMRVGVAQVLF